MNQAIEAAKRGAISVGVPLYGLHGAHQYAKNLNAAQITVLLGLFILGIIWTGNALLTYNNKNNSIEWRKNIWKNTKNTKYVSADR